MCRKDISALRESLKSAHRRIDENSRVIEGIHEIASNVKTLAIQVKHLADTTTGSIEELKNGLRRQGERLGALESEPGNKWKSVSLQAVLAAVAAAAGMVVGRLIDN